ncbi:MAG: UDP-4-amino-4,6-dideoxy-N-acetyl-beta-L-altrosamine transaminase [Phycisphaerales bacterium]|nr:UDP-4-amino-4,6-dideoxy-N-acetyl-beta-L-altrosamine transaminase [Phycisphaerales bacterium]
MMVADEMIPYGRQSIDESDVQAVVEVLQSDWLTTGPTVDAFEREVSRFTGAEHGVAVNSGTAALHCAMNAIGVGPGDEVIVPAMTFVATANCVSYQGGTPVIADVRPETLLIDPEDVRRRITSSTRAIIAVDYAGQPAEWDELRSIADEHQLTLVADGCHALGAADGGRPVGTLADMTAFSFHPVKHITTGEGGMVVTGNPEWAESMRRFRNHGMTTDGRQREEGSAWQYDVTGMGWNYRLTDIQCALGSSQLKRLPGWLDVRDRLACRYSHLLRDVPGVDMLQIRPDVRHAWHLLVVTIDKTVHGVGRNAMFKGLRSLGIGANVHYRPLTCLTRFSSAAGQCPIAESLGERILTLPLHQQVTEVQVEHVVDSIRNVLSGTTVQGEL